MSINNFLNNYKNKIPSFKSNRDVALFVSTEYDTAVKLGSATGVPPAGGPSAKFLTGNKLAMVIVISKAMDLSQKLKKTLTLDKVLPTALSSYWVAGGLTLTSTASGMLPPSVTVWPTLSLPGAVKFDYSKSTSNHEFSNVDDYILALKKFLNDWTSKTSFTMISPTGTPITVSYKLG